MTFRTMGGTALTDDRTPEISVAINTMYRLRSDAEANNPGPGYWLKSWQDMHGQVWHQWVMEMKDPYVMLLERIEKLEKDVAELKGGAR